MSPKDHEFNNAIVLDSNFILLRFDFINEIYLSLEGKTRFLIFKQSLNELEAGNARRDPKPKGFRKKNIPELSYLDKIDFTNRVEPKVSKIRRQYRLAMKYLEKNEKIYPIYFVDDIKKDTVTTDDFLLGWCKHFNREYKNVYLATCNTDLIQQAKLSRVNLIYLVGKNKFKIEKSKKKRN